MSWKTISWKKWKKALREASLALVSWSSASVLMWPNERCSMLHAVCCSVSELGLYVHFFLLTNVWKPTSETAVFDGCSGKLALQCSRLSMCSSFLETGMLNVKTNMLIFWSQSNPNWYFCSNPSLMFAK